MIHGDFTNDNVIASGNLPAATGVIDFALAHIENPLAGIGYALWRSGRPAEHATDNQRYVATWPRQLLSGSGPADVDGEGRLGSQPRWPRLASARAFCLAMAIRIR